MAIFTYIKNALIAILLAWLFLAIFAFFPPHTLIFVVLVLMVWYFSPDEDRSRIKVRDLFVFLGGITAIVAIAAYVPASMLGSWGGICVKEVSVKVSDRSTKLPIGDAEVALASKTSRHTSTQSSKTDAMGTATLSCDCASITKNSILRTWTTYKTKGWEIEASSPGYLPAEILLSDTVAWDQGGTPINFYIQMDKAPPGKK
jgi:hypothetical protein